MKKIVDKLKKRIIINHKMFLFLFVLFMVGLTFGSLFVTILKETDQNIIKASLNTFFTSISKNTLNVETTLISSLITGITYILFVWLLGISIIGLPIVLILYFSKAFTLGFSIGSILFYYKGKGILLALAYIFPHHILNFFIYTILSIYSLSLSLKIIDALMHKKKLDFRFILNKYLFILIVSLLSVLISILYEIFIMPNVVGFVLKLVS